jgi:ATP-dependent RNA circularization protein (DNA/RNA ligase family)
MISAEEARKIAAAKVYENIHDWEQAVVIDDWLNLIQKVSSEGALYVTFNCNVDKFYEWEEFREFILKYMSLLGYKIIVNLNKKKIKILWTHSVTYEN